MNAADNLADYLDHVRSQFPDGLDRLIRAARLDLNYGPFDPAEFLETEGWEYPGWTTALRTIADQLPDTSDVWIDNQCGGWTDTEPQGEWIDTGDTDDDGEPAREWVEPCWEDFTHYDASDVRAALLGSLAEYL